MKNHFLYFTKAERFGIIGLLLVCLALWIIPACMQEDTVVPIHSDETAADSEMQTNIAVLEQVESGIDQELHPFDPNEVSAATLLEFGLPERTVRSWQNYLQKGGRFKNWKDIQDFRALSISDRERLKPFLLFSKAQAKREPTSTADIPPVLAAFDPNEQTVEGLLQMGLSSRVATNWVNYLKAGGRFKSTKDIRKVYGLSEADYDRLAPFVLLADPMADWDAKELVPETTLPSSYEQAERSVVVDINQASAEEWQRLRGIGPAYSRRIVKFRDKLGGFHSVAQIKETYGLPDSVYQTILLQLRPSPLFRYLPINRATVDELAAHPYLRYQDAHVIVNYRKEHGRFTTHEDLELLYGLSDDVRAKMKPYWDFES